MRTVVMVLMFMLSHIRLKRPFSGSYFIEDCKVFGGIFVELYHTIIAAEANFTTLVLDAYVATHCIKGFA